MIPIIRQVVVKESPSLPMLSLADHLVITTDVP